MPMCAFSIAACLCPTAASRRPISIEVALALLVTPVSSSRRLRCSLCDTSRGRRQTNVRTDGGRRGYVQMAATETAAASERRLWDAALSVICASIAGVFREEDGKEPAHCRLRSHHCNLR